MKGKGRGFASMNKTRLKEISSKGGKGTSPENRRFFIDREAAAECGSKGHEGKGRKKDNKK